MKFAAAISTELAAAAPAANALADGGTAIDAVMTGFLAAAAERAGVLLSPVQILVAGPSVGTRAFDGRMRQPGLGAPRPRGFVRGTPIPPAAHAGAPASLAALAVAHAHDSALGLGRICRPAIESARDRSASGRANVLAKFAMQGAAVLRDSGIARSLVAAAGRVAGGLLTEEDLAAVRPSSEAPHEIGRLHANRRVLLPPWQGLLGTAGRLCEIIAAGDRRGVLAILAYTPDDDGVPVPELGLTIPRDAVPVMRGIPRTSPGTPCPAPKPLALILEDSVPLIALGARSTQTPSESAWPAIVEHDVIHPILDELKQAVSGLSAVGIVSSSSRGRAEMNAFAAQ